MSFKLAGVIWNDDGTMATIKPSPIKALESWEEVKDAVLEWTAGYEEDLDIIETTLKNQQRKLDLIGEVLVDTSKGNYADLNDAINEIREILESE